VIRKGGRKPRRVTFINAKLRRGEDWANVQIGNVSSSGLMLRANDPPPVGAPVTVCHRGWSMTGHVVWQERSRVGVQADETIDEEGLLAASGLGRKHSNLLHAAPSRSIWHWLRRR
jgi:hypothetical protein